MARHIEGWRIRSIYLRIYRARTQIWSYRVNSRIAVIGKSRRKAVLIVLLLAGCAGTGRYELSKDEGGRLVRLDTVTGEIMLVDGERLVAVKGSEAATAKTLPPAANLPAAGKSWPTRVLVEMGDASAELTTSWVNGKMHYSLELYPLTKRLKLVHSGYSNGSYFTIEIHDGGGKQLAQTDLPTKSLTKRVSSERNQVELFAEGDISMTKTNYDNIGDWRVFWNP